MAKKRTEWLVNKKNFLSEVEYFETIVCGVMIGGAIAVLVMAVTGVLQLFNLTCQCACGSTPIPPVDVFYGGEFYKAFLILTLVLTILILAVILRIKTVVALKKAKAANEKAIKERDEKKKREKQERERQLKIDNDRKFRAELDPLFKSAEIALYVTDKTICDIQMNVEQNKYENVYLELENEKNKMDKLCNIIQKEV